MEKYKSPPVGHEISAVMRGVNPDYFAPRPNWFARFFLGKESPLISSMIGALKADNFSILGISSTNFPEGGLTATITLGESHFATHTYQEYDALYFSMYSCRGPDDATKVIEYLKNAISPADYCEITNEQVPLTGIKRVLEKPNDFFGGMRNIA